MKIEKRKKHINLHTGEATEVIWKAFFNVGYRDIVSGRHFKSIGGRHKRK